MTKRTCLHIHLAVLCAGGTRLALTKVGRRPAAKVKYSDACIAARLMFRMLASEYLTGTLFFALDSDSQNTSIKAQSVIRWSSALGRLR